MNRFKNYLLAAAGFLLMVGAVALTNPNTGHSAPPEKDVRVINSAAEPVPVTAQGTTAITGNVNVANTPTVQAQQSGAWNVNVQGTSSIAGTVHAAQSGNWNVGIAGTPTVGLLPGSRVRVDNTEQPLNVRDVDSAIRQPFQVRLGLSETFTVPANKRAVIEFVALFAQQEVGGTPRFLHPAIAFALNNQEIARYPLAVSVQQLALASGEIRFHDYTVSQLTRLYAEPGMEVSIGSAFSGGPIISYTAAISGYLTDAP